MADILTHSSRNGTGVINNINEGFALLKCHSKHVINYTCSLLTMEKDRGCIFLISTLTAKYVNGSFETDIFNILMYLLKLNVSQIFLEFEEMRIGSHI